MWGRLQAAALVVHANGTRMVVALRCRAGCVTAAATAPPLPAGQPDLPPVRLLQLMLASVRVRGLPTAVRTTAVAAAAGVADSARQPGPTCPTHASSSCL